MQVEDGAIELYDHARYFTVTGRVFRGAPVQIEDHSADLLALYERLTGSQKRWALQPLACGRIPHGQQHTTLVSVAGTLRARRICEEAIEACLQVVNSRQGEQPGSTENISELFAVLEDGGTVKAKPSDLLPPAPNAASACIETGCKARLILGAKGGPLAFIANALIALRRAPEWQGVLHFNESSLATFVKVGPPLENAPAVPFRWADEHDVLTAAWLQHQGISVNKEVAVQAVHAISKEHSFHPRTRGTFRRGFAVEMRGNRWR